MGSNDFFVLLIILEVQVFLSTGGFQLLAQCRIFCSVGEDYSPFEDHLSLTTILKSQIEHHSQGHQLKPLQKISETEIVRKYMKSGIITITIKI